LASPLKANARAPAGAAGSPAAELIEDIRRVPHAFRSFRRADV
jgi:hypothetical protein